MKRRTASTLPILATLLLFVVSTVAVAPASAAGDAKEIFLAQKCNVCHSVPSAGIEKTTKSEKMAGPDIVNLETDAETIQKYLRKDADLNGKKHMKAFTGSDEELGALVQWMLTQKK